MLDASDDLTLLNSVSTIIDFVAWGADAGGDDDAAVSAGQWTDGDYIDTSSLAEAESLGRDQDSTDTDTSADWEDGSSKADPFGIHAYELTQGARNIPEFDEITLIISIMFLITAINIKMNSIRRKRTVKEAGRAGTTNKEHKSMKNFFKNNDWFFHRKIPIL